MVETDFSYFLHNWVVDAKRAAHWINAYADLFKASKSLGIRFIAFGVTNPEGFEIVRLVVAVSTDEALDNFTKVAEKWDFQGWEEVSQDDEIVANLQTPYWERIEPVLEPDPSSEGREIRRISASLRNNEELQKKLGS